MTSHSEPRYMFSYGMNTNTSGMQSRCPDAICVGRAVLRDHRFDFRGHADVTQHDDDVVHGLLWLMGPNDMTVMDRVEGYPDYYIREKLWVECEDGNDYKAWVYKMRETYAVQPPYEGYLGVVYDGYVENGIPTDQLITAMERCYDIHSLVEEYKE